MVATKTRTVECGNDQSSLQRLVRFKSLKQEGQNKACATCSSALLFQTVPLTVGGLVLGTCYLVRSILKYRERRVLNGYSCE